MLGPRVNMFVGPWVRDLKVYPTRHAAGEQGMHFSFKHWVGLRDLISTCMWIVPKFRIETKNIVSFMESIRLLA